MALACYDCNFGDGYLSWKGTAIEILNWWLVDARVLGLCAPIVPPIQFKYEHFNLELKPMLKDEPFIIEPMPNMRGIWIWPNGDTSNSFETVRYYEHKRAHKATAH
jgi:hypothetical protein